MTIRALVMGDGVICYGALEIVGLLLLLLLLLLGFPLVMKSFEVMKAVSDQPIRTCHQCALILLETYGAI